MAKSFSSHDAKQIIEQHKKLSLKLETIINAPEANKSAISKAADAFVAHEVLNLLKDIPIEEINRDKQGFRIKLLREHGYNTIADISTASVYMIASIYGISEDAAYSIRQVVDDIVDQTHKNTKIKLSIDNQTPEASLLVTKISKFRHIQILAAKSRKISEMSKDKIDYAVNNLACASSGLKWLFSSKETKNKATGAYQFLANLASGKYAQDIQAYTTLYGDIQQLESAEAWQDFASNPIQFFNILEEINPGILGNDDSVYGLPEDLAREIQEECFFPEGLLCELRRYQEWGVKYILHQEKVLLGDEMGLGKTIQAIASMVSLRNTGATHFVVVCPASVITNWCREIRKMSLLSVTKIHGSDRKAALQAWIQSGGVAVTTYETIGYITLEPGFRFSMLIVDEAHYIKNPEARRTINVRELALHADRLLYMTGTALENKVDEMIELIKTLNPTIASDISNMTFLSAAPQFREKIAPVYYRRKREDVLTELPDLIENKEWCSMSAAEEAVYERSVLGRNYAEVRRVSWSVDDLSQSSKAKRMLEIIAEAKSEGRKVIVFSFFLDTIRKVKSLLGSQAMNPINGSITPQRRQEIIDEFDKSPAGTVLPAQIQAGGTGLNIQSASVVILCEPQFKPSIENQAISRAYRMGQTRNVLVYRLLCEDSVDEKLMSVLESKQEIFDAFADKSIAASESMELDNTTFGNIIEEEIQRINAKQYATKDE